MKKMLRYAYWMLPICAMLFVSMEAAANVPKCQLTGANPKRPAKTILINNTSNVLAVTYTSDNGFIVGCSTSAAYPDYLSCKFSNTAIKSNSVVHLRVFDEQGLICELSGRVNMLSGRMLYY